MKISLVVCIVLEVTKKGQEQWLMVAELRWLMLESKTETDGMTDSCKLLSALREENQRPRGHSSCYTSETKDKRTG